MANHPRYGTPYEHYRAQAVDPSVFDDQGRPDYLASEPGLYTSGVQFVSNPLNPLRGFFCNAPRQPFQDKGGIYLAADYKLYIPQDLGLIYKLSDRSIKLQDMFKINGQTLYATQPAVPCLQGEITAAYEINLTLQRYPVANG